MITRTMVINDVHLPFSNTKLLSSQCTGLIADIIEDRKLDRLIINGDLLDFYCVNSHGPKHPDISTTLLDELNSGRDFFESLRKRFPRLEVIFLYGNHEDRLDRFILQNAKPFWNVLNIENPCNLEAMGIEYYPYNKEYQVDETNLFIQHSPPSYGVNGARTSLLKKLDRCYIYGCTHREQKATSTGASGQRYSVYFNGWLGSTEETPEHKRVFSYAKGHENWQSTFSIVTVKNKVDFHVNQYSIVNNSTVVDGVLYEA